MVFCYSNPKPIEKVGKQSWIMRSRGHTCQAVRLELTPALGRTTSDKWIPHSILLFPFLEALETAVFRETLAISA